LVFLCLSLAHYATAFIQQSPVFQRKTQLSFEAKPSSTTITTNPDVKTSDQWELDCYSRPVMVGGKKLWEVLITDANGSFRLCETLPSNKVNSRELRRVVDDAIESAEVKPNTVRFFRGAMFNMVRSMTCVLLMYTCFHFNQCILTAMIAD